jgi:hypothetical protein
MLTAAVAFQSRDFTTAYARLHEAARQSQKPAQTLALAIVDRYPGRYLVLPASGRGPRGNSSSDATRSVGGGHTPATGPEGGPHVGPFSGRH